MCSYYFIISRLIVINFAAKKTNLGTRVSNNKLALVGYKQMLNKILKITGSGKIWLNMDIIIIIIVFILTMMDPYTWQSSLAKSSDL